MCQCAGAHTADTGGQAGRQIRCKFVVIKFRGGLTVDWAWRDARCVEGSRSITEMLRRSSARHRAAYCGEGGSAMCHGLDLVT